METVYYNEIDPFCCAWLSNLMAAGLIAPGHIDNRSIADVRPEDIAGYTQCHWFAGIGIWSAALRLAGIPDDYPCWTGSCPCQPFSAAGKRKGFADERHLWPIWRELIVACGPSMVWGEQVWSAESVGKKRRAPEQYVQRDLFAGDSCEVEVEIADAWLDHVLLEMEAALYTVGTVGTPAAGFGAPHQRHRAYFVGVALGDSNRTGLQGWLKSSSPRSDGSLTGPSVACGLPNADIAGRQSKPHVSGSDAAGTRQAEQRDELGARCGTNRLAESMPTRRPEGWAGARDGQAAGSSGLSRVADPEAALRRRAGAAAHGRRGTAEAGRSGIAQRMDNPAGDGTGCGPATIAGGDGQENGILGAHGEAGRPGPVNGLWRNADWLSCRDAKWRPVEPATFPLADAGTFRNRVAELRGAGNAICLAQAQNFIEAVMEVLA